MVLLRGAGRRDRFPGQLCCSFEGSANSWVGPTAANVTRHGCVDKVVVDAIGIMRQQSRRGHDLAWLTVTTLHHVQFQPGLLHRMIGFNALNRGDALSGQGAHRRDAGARRKTVDMYGTRAAKTLTATKLGAGHIQQITQDPQKRHVGFGIYIDRFVVDLQLHGIGRRLSAYWSFKYRARA